MRVLVASTVILSLIPVVAFSGSPSPNSDAGLTASLAHNRKKMVRVLKHPFRVYQPGTTLCAAPVPAPPRSPHGDHWIHVFVSDQGRKAMFSGKGQYPVGSLILKQKFLDAQGKKTDFYTGMRKREPGFNPKLGDWEFFTLDATAKKVTSQGKIAECMNCHQKYGKTDFVVRDYLAVAESGSL